MADLQKFVVDLREDVKMLLKKETEEDKKTIKTLQDELKAKNEEIQKLKAERDSGHRYKEHYKKAMDFIRSKELTCEMEAATNISAAQKTKEEAQKAKEAAQKAKEAAQKTEEAAQKTEEAAQKIVETASGIKTFRVDMPEPSPDSEAGGVELEEDNDTSEDETGQSFLCSGFQR